MQSLMNESNQKIKLNNDKSFSEAPNLYSKKNINIEPMKLRMQVEKELTPKLVMPKDNNDKMI